MTRFDWRQFKSWADSALFAGLIMAASWILPPYLHRARHLCPLRSDGTESSFAVPAFARKYGVSCSLCHTAFPVLNAYGRQFKINGYVMNKGDDNGVLKSADNSLWTEKVFPWGVIIRSRPFDDGRGGVSNQGAQMGGTASPNPNGFKFQPVNDVDFFLAGGDAALHVSWFGEIDANAAGGFTPGLGDLRAGYHPFDFFNVIAARRGFFTDDPYQTIASNESPTLANRATDLLLPDQVSISGNAIASSPQALYAYGKQPISQLGNGFLYYAAGATKDSTSGSQAVAPTNGDARLAFDNGNGLMIGTFGTYGHEWPQNTVGGRNVGGLGGGLGVGFGPSKEQFVRGGFDALYEIGDFAARAAFVYLHDEDPFAAARASDRAAYAELSYNYKRGDDPYPFLMPLVRENWYTTFNDTQQFNFITMQLAHYFAANLKAFVEYSFDTKTSHQGGTLASPASGTLPGNGNRVSLQAEVGF